LEKSFGFGTVGFFDVFAVDLNDGGEAVDDELFEEGAAGDGVARGFDVDDFEVGDILEFSDLEERHDVGFAEL
jgi:hypothetical protein